MASELRKGCGLAVSQGECRPENQQQGEKNAACCYLLRRETYTGWRRTDIRSCSQAWGPMLAVRVTWGARKHWRLVLPRDSWLIGPGALKASVRPLKGPRVLLLGTREEPSLRCGVNRNEATEAVPFCSEWLQPPEGKNCEALCVAG